MLDNCEGLREELEAARKELNGARARVADLEALGAEELEKELGRIDDLLRSVARRVCQPSRAPLLRWDHRRQELRGENPEPVEVDLPETTEALAAMVAGMLAGACRRAE